MNNIRVPLESVNAVRPTVPEVYVADRESQLTNLGNLKDGDIIFLDGRVFANDIQGTLEAIGPGPDVRFVLIYPLQGQSIADTVSVMTKEQLEAAIA